MDTERLIRELAAGLEPVRPLRRPWRRAAAWMGTTALGLAALLVLMQGDVVPVREPGFVLEQALALALGATAATAAFATVVPGYRRRLLLVPAACLLLWLGVVALGAWQEVQARGAEALLVADWGCVFAILAAATVPVAAMAMMLRRGAPLTPAATAMLGGLAAAAFANVASCVAFPHDSDLIVLVWHGGTVLALAVLSGLIGGGLLGAGVLARTAHSGWT